MIIPRQIPRLPKWVILSVALVLLAATAQTVYALTCIGAYNEKLLLKIESVEIDGVSQEDLSSYHELDIYLTTYYSANELVLLSSDGNGFSEIYVFRPELP